NVNSGNNNFLDRATVVSPTVGSISGSVFQDVNHDGLIDFGDAPIQGILVQVSTQSGFVAQTFTDANGAYAFGNLAPGFYQVMEQVSAGLTPVATFPGVNGFRINGSATTLAV